LVALFVVTESDFIKDVGAGGEAEFFSALGFSLHPKIEESPIAPIPSQNPTPRKLERSADKFENWSPLATESPRCKLSGLEHFSSIYSPDGDFATNFIGHQPASEQLDGYS
jgi:hypothetical protein